MTTIGPPVAEAADKRFLLSTFAALAATVAFLFGALGIVVIAAVRPGSSSVGAGVPTTLPVTLSEMKITPASLSAPAGSVTIQVTNGGSMAHSFSVPALGKKTADLAAGQSTKLDLGNVAAGTYEVRCEVPGHADGGMKGTLTVTAGGSGAGAAGGSGAGSAAMAGMDHSGTEDWARANDEMRAGMAKGLETFVKGDATKGVGNQKLVPVIEPDGTKVFRLTAAITDWEVAPGRTVKAWTYNGIVPGPWIRTEPGDKVKVVVENKLPVDTDVHFHGITTPFDMDGVAPLTQSSAIEPGGTFTYRWTNVSHPELGMYHAHDHGQVGIPNGLFAVFQVGDVAVPSGQRVGTVDVPAGRPTQELPLVLNDAGVIGLSLNGKSFPATAPIAAKPGDSILVHYYNEGLLAHPMHLHHLPQLVVAKDGFPLAQPYLVDTLNVAPGERYSVVIAPTAADVGVWAWHCHILNHAENAEGLFGMVTALVVKE